MNISCNMEEVMTDLEKIQETVDKITGCCGKDLCLGCRDSLNFIIKFATTMDKQKSELIQDNYWLKQSIEAENDRLDRNNRLEMQNEVLRAKEQHYIHDMNEMLKVNERLTSDLQITKIFLEVYQRNEAIRNSDEAIHMCSSCCNDECANSYPGDGSNLDFCDYYCQRPRAE